jgi:hypothetical protein
MPVGWIGCGHGFYRFFSKEKIIWPFPKKELSDFQNKKSQIF